jgi:NAD(P)H dehydrogenase (quinone)
MRILIIGALGNLASLTAAMLAASFPDIQLRLTSHRLIGLERLHAQYPIAEVVYADWNDFHSLRNAVRGVDRVLVVTTDWVIDESVATSNLIRALELEGRVETLLRFIALPPGLTRESLTPDLLATRAGAMLTLIAKPLLDASRLPVCYVNAACWIGFNISWFYAHDIRALGQIRMPSATDMPRRWVTEGDLSEVFAKILTEAPRLHVSHHYHVAGGPTYTYEAQAAVVGQVLGKDVRWVDDDSSLRRIMGDKFDKLFAYLVHEVDAYRNVPAMRDLELLLGRERTTLEQYVQSIRPSLV